MTFRRRDYPELLEGILTSLAGGVSAEAHPFPPPGDADNPRMELDAPPARLLVSVHGARNGASFRFRTGSDVELSPDGAAVLWRQGGQRPDPGTLVEIAYLRRDAKSQLTDLEVGGIARTIVEAVARETAQVHAELQAVYEAAFLETATGRSLDNVVALVGVERVTPGRARTKLSFTRDPGSAGAITIAAGTRVMDASVQTEYETVETVTLSPAQTRVSVDALDVEPGNAPVAANVLTILPVPIAGIVAVTNPAPAGRAEAGETDEELRTRARAFLQGSERATVGALRSALARQGVRGEIVEPADRPGVVIIKPIAGTLTPERREQLLAAIDDARPAGVRVELELATPPAGVDLVLELRTGAGLADGARRAAHEEVREVVTDYLARLRMDEDARINQIVGLVLGVAGVEDVTLVSARLHLPDGTTADPLDTAEGTIKLAGVPTALADLSIADPNLPTRADLRILFPASAPAPDRNEVTAAVEAAFAYLGERAAAEDPIDQRTLSFGKLLLALPGPVGGEKTLAAHDAAPNPKPALPTASGVYQVSLFIEQANGLTRMLTTPADSYLLGPRERLALNSVNIDVAS
jgi:hypothetical protein